MSRITLSNDEMLIIEDALTYYRLCTAGGGPSDHDVQEIRKVERKITRLVATAEELDAEGVSISSRPT